MYLNYKHITFYWNFFFDLFYYLGSVTTSLQYLDSLGAQHLVEEGNMFKCLICGWPFKQKINAKFHIESKHFPTVNGYHCELCNKYFNTYKAVIIHNNTYHKNIH